MMILLAALFTVSPQVVEINEPITVMLEMPQDKKIDPALMKGKLLSSGHFMLVSESQMEQNGKIRYQWVLEALTPGVFPLSLYKIQVGQEPPEYLPAFEIEVKTFSNPENLPPPPFLPVNPQLPPEISAKNQKFLAAIEDRQPEVNRLRLNAKAFPWYALFLTLFALATLPFILWILDKRDKSRIPLSPEQAALGEIKLLEQQGFIEPEPLITGLSQTLRFYIQKKYGLSSPHQTTEEFLSSSAFQSKLDPSQKNLLALFLKAADLVKFAGRTPTHHEIQTAISFAKTFVSNN